MNIMPAKKTTAQFQIELDQISKRSIVLEPADQHYVSAHEIHTWRCTIDGHVWSAPYIRVLRGHGCPVCGNRTKTSSNAVNESDFRARLDERNKSSPPISYVSGFRGMTKKALFHCDTCAHEWNTLPKTVVGGSGCPMCKVNKNTINHTYTNSQFITKLNNRNRYRDHKIYVAPGQRYVGYKNKLKFVCEHGHEWFTRPETVWNNVGGCPHCAGVVKRGTQAAIEEIYSKHPLVVIVSTHDEQLGRRELLEVQCAEGHTWDTHYERLVAGSGCPHCYGNAKMTHTQFVNKLSKVTQTIAPLGTYENSHEPIDVRCTVCHHEWKPRPYNLLNGYGCPSCSRNNKFSKKALVWLRYVEATNNIVIRHAKKGGEYRIPGTRYRCDGFCEETNTVYEFYGDYWHGNPNVYDGTSYNTHLNKSYGHLYDATLVRETAIRTKGYELVSLWEQEFDEIMTNSFLCKVLQNLDVSGMVLTTSSQHVIRFDSVTSVVVIVNVELPPESDSRKQLIDTTLNDIHDDRKIFVLFSDEIENNTLISAKINHYLHTSSAPTRIHARQCEVRPCTKPEKRQLLDTNHVQGNDNSQIMYGAYYADQLVSVMTFSPPRTGIGVHTHKTGGEWELVRFCTDINYRIPGIASKLLKHFQRNHEWKEIYSYADKRWSVGNMYHKLGFELVADNPPDYFYVIDGQRKHRWNYRKDILKNTLVNYDPSLTEYQNMVNHGFWRVWDCGTLKFSVKPQDMLHPSNE